MCLSVLGQDGCSGRVLRRWLDASWEEVHLPFSEACDAGDGQQKGILVDLIWSVMFLNCHIWLMLNVSSLGARSCLFQCILQS